MRKILIFLILISNSIAFAQQLNNDSGPASMTWPPAIATPVPDKKLSAGSTPTDAHRVPAINNQVPLALPSDKASSETLATQFITPPPPVNLLSGKDSTLTAREVANIATAKKWIDGPKYNSRELAVPGSNGAVIFRYGAAMPSIVCAVGYVCDIAFQPGEIVNTVQVGDPVRWKIVPATSGIAPALVTHAVIKPSDIGLATNLLVTTDRRAYSLKLVSRKEDFMPSISFSYPEDEAAQWASLAQQRAEVIAATVIPETGQSLGALDFGYRIEGDSPIWKPLRVYTDGVKTYIQFPKAMKNDESPVLVALGNDKKEQWVNYRVNGDRYVVDKVLNKAMLLSGVGRKQVKIKIERKEEH